MAILHGSWLIHSQADAETQAHQAAGTVSSDRSTPFQGSLFLWGEVWRRIEPEMLHAGQSDVVVERHPFAMPPLELLAFLRSRQQSGKLRLPTSLLESVAEPPTETTVNAKRGRSKQGTTTVVEAAALSGQWQTRTLAIPSHVADDEWELPAGTIVPQHSAANDDRDCFLHPWNVEGLHLNAIEALAFLNSLPLGTVDADDPLLGGDLRFWSHTARWSLDLLARSKFLPGLERAEERGKQGEQEERGERSIGWARWQPLLDSAVDQVRWKHFVDRMPLACRMSEEEGRKAEEQEEQNSKLSSLSAQSATQNSKLKTQNSPLALPLPLSPQTLLQAFISSTLDAQIRLLAQRHFAAAPEKAALGVVKVAIASPVREWLQALGQATASVDAAGLDSLEAALTNWTAPLQYNGAQQNLFRTCLYLHPPQASQNQWLLEYFLQSADDDDFLVSALTIWGNPVEQLHYRGRTIDRPQETLLMGLGLASRLYAPIEPSLQEARPQFCSLTALQAYDFLKVTAWRLQDSGLGVVLPPSLANQSGWANRLGLKIQAQSAKLNKGQVRLGLQSLLNFRWELSIGGQSLSKAEFDRLVALNAPLVEINGEWVELRPQDIRAAQTFFASRKDQTALSLEDALRISTGDTQTIEKLPVVSFEASGPLQELITTLSGNRQIEALPTPKNFRGTLRPYQSRGVGWLAFLEQWGLGACLADDMGLGKTIQLIAFLLHLKEQKTLEYPTLLVCPTSVLGNWEREVKKFGPTLTAFLYHGDKRPQGKAFAKAVQGKDLVITSYALIHRDIKSLQPIAWQGVVLDEAQNVKNPDAKQSQAVRELDAQFRIALTGTPVENRLSELWSILDFLNPGYLGPKNFFQRRFATPIERYGDTASLATLRSLVQPFLLRRLKTDRDIIQDLPEKQEMTVFCGLSSEQASLYQHTVEQSLKDIEAAEGIQRKGIILALLVKLKQICNHPALFLKEDGGEGKDKGSRIKDKNSDNDLAVSLYTSAFLTRSGKLQRLEEMLEEVVAEGDRALIFTQFAEWGKLLKAHLERQLGRETLFLYGSTSKKQREEMVDRFQHDPQGPRIFILSLKAGGVGLNLTRANHVFHFDRWWNPAVENQATDRVFRIGQTRNVQVHKFVCNGTLEEKVHELIESKKALAENVIGTGENWLTELDTNSLRDLLLLDRSAIIGEE
ncbi:DEAD/DEAH box helicase [Stenomitos frigidus]|uniref:ATP-dependent helicase n=1 Tax=Stenomitos frigidus ULC18 TaxID=2107698 RepID=A0A2T1E5S4_9CYAN|nr:DEAD/DEAH box helicase [Stenomitos frigidus]PSB28102.1 ATP-dependent helicase [Stenomitos frigidus ULC18]